MASTYQMTEDAISVMIISLIKSFSITPTEAEVTYKVTSCIV